MNKRKIFNDPVHGFITIPYELIFDIIEHKYFQRLRRIKQLSMSEYIYPGALHTRFHHALGAFHLMRKALNVLKAKNIEITPEEESGACIAILLHDIGHGPFSHTLERCLIAGVNHEVISKMYFEKLNQIFNGQLDIAIQIFENNYPKKFLHQLVSSQLDVDRLDYLTRDSFYTGVSEGVVSYDRILEMMNVADDELVIEQKGIYSIEKFIISRRLMYWQVYLHKTVLSVEQMLIQAIERAKALATESVLSLCSPALRYFLQNTVTLEDFLNKDEPFDNFSLLDDVDIVAALKQWQFSHDPVLSRLCSSILDRRLFKIEIQQEAFSAEKIALLKEKVQLILGLSKEDAEWLVLADSTYNHAYNPKEESIKILQSNGQVVDISSVSEHIGATVISQKVIKHYICYPKEIFSL
jgi:HD superfamily phosphohydrolase